MERKSNIEILRILAFFMVVFTHITPVALTIPNGIEHNSFSWYYATIVRCLVTPAITIFIMISGYVCYFNKEKYSVKKNLKRIFIPVLVFIPLLFSINILENNSLIKATKEFFNMVLSVTGSLHHLWYIVAYAFLIIITPILIKGIEEYNKKSFTLLLFTLYLLIGGSELITILGKINVFQGMFRNNLIYFIMIFLTGYYINKYNIKIKKTISFLLGITVICINYKIFLINNPMNAPLNYMTIANTFSLLNILQSICIFMFFKEIHIKKINIINYISRLTYGAYIVHVAYIYYNQKFFPFLQYVNNENYYIYDIAFCISVILCSLITEQIRQSLTKLIKRILEFTKIIKKNNMETVQII